MTPLAQKLMRQELEGRRGIFFGRDLLPLSELVNVRCFDCTAVTEMAYSLADDMCFRDAIPKQVAFLPAPLTLIEYFFRGTCRRVAFLLQTLEDTSETAAVYQVTSLTYPDFTEQGQEPRPDLVNKVHLFLFGLLELGDGVMAAGLGLPKSLKDIDFPDPNNGHVQLIYALLAIINTPRLIGQTQHNPHVGLQRQVDRSGDMAGAQLLKWTQVKLCVLDHADRRAEGDASGVLTGQRALHFCRSFIRIRLGRLELVRAHMRGNPDLGERRPIYTVA